MKDPVVAVAQYPIDFLTDWDSYRAKLTRWVAEAAAGGAQLAVFPEYGSMELASLFGAEVYTSLPAQLEALQSLLPRWLALHRELAERYQLYLAAASFPVREGVQYRNRAHLIAPDGAVDHQDKIIMTRFERERWGVSGGDRVKVFETGVGRIGISICYDVEFPLIARAQAEAGAEIILAPSNTDTEAGYYRVRIGAQARALENQCFVLHSPTVGRAEWSEAVDPNLGAAAVYAPVDLGFPATGILAMGERERPQWLFSPLPLRRARRIRRAGQVLNFRDWPEQATASAQPVQVVAL